MGQRERRGGAAAIAGLQGPRLWALAAGGGLAAATALLPSPLPAPGLTPLLWLGLALLWALLESAAPRRAAACWAGVAVVVSHRWLLALHPLDWIGVPLPLSLPLCWLLLFLCAALAGLLLACWAQLALWLRPRRASSGVVLACIWGLAEVALARGPLFWIGLGEAALPGDPPLAALARLGGSALVAAVQVWLGWALWRLLLAGGLPVGRRLRAWGVLALVLVLLGLHGLGQAQLALLAAPAAAAPLERALLLQPAIPTRETLQPQARRLL
jgi:apolipoprotein N-acyltransferase